MTTKKDIQNIIASSLPSEEEIEEMDKRQHEQSFDNPNAFHNWFPVIRSLGIRTPWSKWAQIDRKTQAMILNGKADLLTEDGAEDLGEAVSEVRKFSEQVGSPVFLKTGLFSAKHDWDTTCFIDDFEPSNVARHIANLFYTSALYGVERSPHLVMREFIPTTPVFYAFEGNTPITQEFRLFTENYRVTGFQPYWPEKAIEGNNPSANDWREKLESISKPDASLLNEMYYMAEKAATLIEGGDWSVDFLIDDNKRPWLIDMAIASQSFCCPDGYRTL